MVFLGNKGRDELMQYFHYFWNDRKEQSENRFEYILAIT